MSTRLDYHAELTTTAGMFDASMGDFSTASALELALLANSLVGLQFSDFISDSRVVVDVTPNPGDAIPCSVGTSTTSRQACNQVFYMPGTTGDLDLPSNATAPHADLVVVYDMRGYQPNFSTSHGNARFSLKNDCQAYGFNQAAFQICFGDVDEAIAISKFV